MRTEAAVPLCLRIVRLTQAWTEEKLLHLDSIY